MIDTLDIESAELVDVEKLFNELNQDALIAYKGEIDSDLITNVLEILEVKLISSEEPNRLKRRVYNITVETLQNLFHHLDELPDEYDSSVRGKFAVFSINKYEQGFKLFTGNFIENTRVIKLEKHLEYLMSLSRDQLKALRLKTLSDESSTSEYSDGLGILDVAYRTNGQIKYDFFEYSKDYSLFCLYVNIL